MDTNCLSLYHTVLTFNDLETRNLLKTLWEKEKMLVTSVLYCSQNKFHFSVTFILLSANAFNLDQYKILSFGKELITFI